MRSDFCYFQEAGQFKPNRMSHTGVGVFMSLWLQLYHTLYLLGTSLHQEDKTIVKSLHNQALKAVSVQTLPEKLDKLGSLNQAWQILVFHGKLQQLQVMDTDCMQAAGAMF